MSISFLFFFTLCLINLKKQKKQKKNLDKAKFIWKYFVISILTIHQQLKQKFNLIWLWLCVLFYRWFLVCFDFCLFVWSCWIVTWFLTWIYYSNRRKTKTIYNWKFFFHWNEMLNINNDHPNINMVTTACPPPSLTSTSTTTKSSSSSLINQSASRFQLNQRQQESFVPNGK